METEDRTRKERWQLVIRLSGSDSVTTGEQVLDLVDATSAAGVSAADFRAKTVLLMPGTSVSEILRWAWLCGVAGRLLDVEVAGVQVNLAPLVHAGRAQDTPKPSERRDRFDINVSTVLGGELDDAAITSMQWSKRCGLDTEEVPVDDVVRVVAWVSGLRDRRGDGGRLPQLSVGDQELDLEGARLDGVAHRRTTNAASQTARVDAIPLTQRQLRLTQAAARPLEEVLSALGCYSDGDLWNCPRPHNHTHGDATPSAKITAEGFRCFRCDTERIDPLRLVMASCNLGPDDAAAALEDPVTRLAPWRAVIVTERENRSGVQQ